MVEISLYGSGEGSGWVTAPGYSTAANLIIPTSEYGRLWQVPTGGELVDAVFEQPNCRIADIVEAGIAGRQAASRYLKALVSIGVLREQVFGREKLFVHSRLLDLLTRDEDDPDATHH